MSSTIRFGSSLGPRAVHSTAELLNGEPDDPSDPNKMLQCPYDKNHQIRASRFPYHILKCRKNHPKLAEELKTCPFNAKHLMPKHELSQHIENCEDRLQTFFRLLSYMILFWHVCIKCCISKQKNTSRLTNQGTVYTFVSTREKNYFGSVYDA
uniref:Zgc:56699 n=1 Tax=Astyanax mexicanus TaxID=7994 RepID=A0A8B9HK92_ASTMX